MGRRHGRPLEVMPRHVVAGFLESERPIRDSGVLAINGMVVISIFDQAARKQESRAGARMQAGHLITATY